MISTHPEWQSFRHAPIKGNKIQRWIKSRFRYVDYPFLLAYRGFGNRERYFIQGHVFRGMALRRPKKKNSIWKNIVSMIKMFLVRTVPEAKVELVSPLKSYLTASDENGFFQFEIEETLAPGWHKVELKLKENIVEGQEEVTVTAEFLILHDAEYGLISDIDDTFLVSHVTQKPRKIYTLLTKNAESRKPVEGIVDFYNALCRGVSDMANPFFYVSSSEWNLYEFLVDFKKHHNLPKGVLQLKELKDSLFDFFKSGYGSHDHKHVKIKKILSAFPTQKFILLGDNGQHDPDIYLQIADEFTDQIRGVYIRGVKKSNRKKTEEKLEKVKKLRIPCLQFKSVAEAFDHARKNKFIINED